LSIARIKKVKLKTNYLWHGLSVTHRALGRPHQKLSLTYLLLIS